MNQDRLLALARRFADLAPAQRSVFLQRLADQNIDFSLLPIPPRTQAEAGIALPASFAQARLWFLWQMDPESPAYNMAGRLRLVGELNVAALTASVQSLLARHEGLRTTFLAGSDGAALQKVHPVASLDLRHVDLQHLSEMERESAAKAEALRPFDLASGPLLRVMLIRCNSNTHCLLLTVHHIVSDGWSAEVMLRELAEGYRLNVSVDFDVAVAIALPEKLFIQYPDFALWQRRWLEAGEAERQRNWWRKTLGDDHPVLALPTDRQRPAIPSSQGARQFFTLTPQVTEQLRTLARGQGVTLFMVLLASFKALLYRYSGQDDIRVGVPAAGRNRIETEGLIGFFINTLVVRSRPSGQKTFAELLLELKDALLGAEAHQDLPFEQLVEALQDVRSTSHHPLFQVMANHQTRGATPQWDGLVVDEVSEGNPVAKFDLTLTTEESADGVLSGAFVYAAELFLPSTITRLTGHYLGLLEQVAQSPSITLNQLALLSDAEQAQITRWNAAADQTVEKLFVPIHTALTAQAEMYGDRIALCHGVTTVSFDELNVRSNRLAHRLIASGVKAEVRVGVSIERSAEMIIALLAILKAGGAFVPLDPRYPAARLSYMLSDAGVQHLVTQRGLSTSAITTKTMTTLYVEDVQNEDSTEYDHPPAVVIHPSQSAYLIYTSGSTGQPKGVTVEHGPLARHCQAIGERYQMSVEDRVLHFASINFDLAHEYWLMPLLFGARLVITDNVLWSPAETCAQLAHHGVTVAAFPPSYLVQLAEAAQARQDKLALRVLAFGGEALSREHFELVRTVFAPATLINGYGPTETVISPMLWITQPDTDPAEWQHNAYLPIGTPVGARSAYVLDAALNALPVGVAGELYLGGAELARGYHARAGMTAERFIPDPFCAGGRLYRTGDRARWRSDGSVDYLGRLDHQVKLRGVRIEPGEIEAQLLACLGVREAAVLVHGDGGDGQLVAYLVAEESGAPLDRTLLKSQLQQRLPDYMVPAQFMLLDRLPVTANGKLDRRALPAPTWKGRAYRAPESVVEISLGAIWAEVLKLDRVGLDDHFFELGGHSLLATQMCARIQRRLGLVVPLRYLFQTPVLSEFSARVATECRSAELALIPKRPPEASVPLSFAQQGLWLLWLADPEDAGYNIYSALRFRGALDYDTLQASFDALVARHVVLRTTFMQGKNDSVLQRIHPPAPVQMTLVDLSHWADAERETEAQRLAEVESLRPFHLENGPLLRVQLIQMAAADHILLLSIHHIVADGWSIGLIFNELMALYRGFHDHQSIALPPMKLDYADYAFWQRLPTVANSDAATRDATDRAYWRQQLNAIKPLNLPRPQKRVQLPGMRGEQLLFTLESNLISRARDVAQRNGATLSMLLQATFHALLYRHTGQADHCIGILAANRDRIDIEPVVGLFLNALTLRAQIDPKLGFSSLLGAVKETHLAAQMHVGLPFSSLVEDLSPVREAGRNPLFQVLYNFLRPDFESLSGLPGMQIDDFPVPRRTVVFDLELDVVEDVHGAVCGAFSYAVERIDATFVTALRDDYSTLLAALLDAPDLPIAGIVKPIMNPANGQKITPVIDVSIAPIVLPLYPEWESILTQVWIETLGVAAVARDDNFFALGGSSLLCLTVLAQSNRFGLGLGLSLADLFLHQTIAQLAAAKGASLPCATKPHTRTIVPRQTSKEMS
ncbi:amino acid adenylation domain-containing protein [Glaciimonas sp. Gout2]|uniref:non-ribosomal peptide synthetase n=2 Tax=Glaciimonas TaxID=1229970 RepID=UPI002B2315E6|nr:MULTISPECIES: non-ribosomal peptide synthetase [unclassified Glaciimonas]MEB0013428.1 amino acid adenylation domain-containing protein [Glaciimonas sp. Cout2]MEB0081510.1 amino acid adenylation domain-containing protein [Glaciimonas sp. Gout2]